MNREELEKNINELDRAINVAKEMISDITDEEELASAKELIEEQEQKLESLKKELESFEDEQVLTDFNEIVEAIQKLNPDVEIRVGNPSYDSEAWSRFYSSVSPSQLNLPKGFYFNEKNGITNKHNTKSGSYSALRVEDLSKAYENKLLPKKELPTEKPTPSVQHKKGEPVKENKNRKTIKDRALGVVAKGYNHIINKRVDRVNSPLKYFLPRAAISTAIATLFIVSTSFVGGGIPAISALAFAYLGMASGKFIVALSRKAKGYNPRKITAADINKITENTKSNYKNNVKNNEKIDKKTPKKNVPAGAAKLPEMKEPVLDKLVHDFNVAIDSIEDINDLESNSYKYAKNKCTYLYDLIQKHYGEDGLHKITSERLTKYNEIKEGKFTKNPEEKPQENEVVEIKNDYVKSLLQEMFKFELVTTRQSVNACEKILKEIDTKLPENSDLRKNPEYKPLWNKYNYLKESLVTKKRVLKFVDLVNEISSNKGEIEYDKFKECFDIQVKFQDEDWKELNDVENNSAVMKKYQAILKKSRHLVLEYRLENMDVEELINNNKYDEIKEVVQLADILEKEFREKRAKNPINSLKLESKEKITRCKEVLDKLDSYNKVNITVKLVVNKVDSSIKAYFNNEDEVISMPMKTKFNGNITEIIENVKKEINAINPLIDNNKITVESITMEEENEKANTK